MSNPFRTPEDYELFLYTLTEQFSDVRYEIWRGEEKLYWYDSQPHPNEPSLQSTHPHHKHIPPDLKHNRVPAPTLSFTQPNLPTLIRQIHEVLSQPEANP